MKLKIRVIVGFVMSMSILTACSAADIFVPETPEERVEIPATEVVLPLVVTQEPAVVETEKPAPLLSFDAATYREASAGIEFSYPSNWTEGPREVIGERGAQAALLSPGSSVEQLADGGTRLFLTTYVWDPKNDLAAYVAQRNLAWEASGFRILGEEELQLTDGRRVVVFTVETIEGSQVLFALLNAGQDYLQISGDGNLELAMEIIRTIRISD